jgi:tRNA/rRNA methyltransferase
LEAGAPLIRRQLATGPVALVFGSEKFGLANEDLSHCHWLVRITTREAHISMNLGQAVAICLYELVREGAAPGPAELPPSAAAGEVERITEVLIEALRVSGYMKPKAGATTEEKTRRLVRRLHWGARDAEVFLGMLRRVLWKLRQE